MTDDARKQKEIKRQTRKLVAAAGDNDLAGIEQAMAAGADINGRGGFWRFHTTALGYAAWSGAVEAMRELIRRGADLNDTGSDFGHTPLHWAIENDKILAARVLVEAGADLKARNHDKMTPLQFALKRKRAGIAAMLTNAEHLATVKRAEEMLRQARAETRQLAPEKKENPDIVIFSFKAGDRTLEEVFNFVSFEQISLTKRNADGALEAQTRRNFADIDNDRLLRRAFEEHKRRGGAALESEVFPDAKPRLSKPSAGLS